MKIDKSIQHLLEWATAKIEAQQEPPWARPHYEQLRETLTAIQRGRKATIMLEDSQTDTDPPLGKNVHSLDSARLRRGEFDLPM